MFQSSDNIRIKDSIRDDDAIKNSLEKVRTLEEKLSDYVKSSPDYNLSSQSSDNDTLAQECLAVFNTAVSLLQPRHKDIYRLKIEERLTTQQIAERLNLSTSVVSRTLQRVRHHIATHLSHNGWPNELQQIEYNQRYTY